MDEGKAEKGVEDLQGRVLHAVSPVDCQDGAAVSREVVRGEKGAVTVFSFDEGQGLSGRASPRRRGRSGYRRGGLRLTAGEMVIMPANVPHALNAVRRFKEVPLGVSPGTGSGTLSSPPRGQPGNGIGNIIIRCKRLILPR